MNCKFKVQNISIIVKHSHYNSLVATSCMPPPLSSGLLLCSITNNKNKKMKKHDLLPTTLSDQEIVDISNLPDNLLTAGLTSVMGAIVGCIATPILLFIFVGTNFLFNFNLYLSQI